MKALSNTEAELKKSVAYKKKAYNISYFRIYAAGISLFEINNGNTKKMTSFWCLYC